VTPLTFTISPLPVTDNPLPVIVTFYPLIVTVNPLTNNVNKTLTVAAYLSCSLANIGKLGPALTIFRGDRQPAGTVGPNQANYVIKTKLIYWKSCYLRYTVHKNKRGNFIIVLKKVWY
jgi:hypothetical protein